MILARLEGCSGVMDDTDRTNVMEYAVRNDICTDTLLPISG